ncbi:MAG: hypothetical protein ACRDL5_07960 [Solirubrobacteraceae bacterium]
MVALAGVFALGVAPALAGDGGVAKLTTLLFQKGDEWAYVRQGPLQTAANASAWAHIYGAKSARSADIKRWRSEGLMAAAMVGTGTAAGSEGVSWVERLKSPASAEREAADVFSTDTGPKQQPVTAFSVPGVAHAKGFAYAPKNVKPTADNVVWTQGACTLLLGNYNTGGLSINAIAKAVKAIYVRTGHRCPA